MAQEHEKTYCFEFTEKQVENIKHALAVSGLYSQCNLEIYKTLCEAVCDDDDRKTLLTYGENI